VVVGGPTHIRGMTSGMSRKMGISGEEKAEAKGETPHELEPDAEGPGLRDWFDVLPKAAQGAVAAAFDTRLGSSMAGGAAKGIARRLRRHGYHLLSDPEGSIATYGDGPLHLVFCAEHDALPPDALSDRMPAEFAEVIPVQTEKPAGRLAPGKTLFVHAGAFRNVHAALMAHPFPTPYGAFIPTHTYGRLLAEFSRSSGATRGQLDAAALRALETALSTAISDLHQSLLQCRTEPEDADGGAVNHTRMPSSSSKRTTQ
jgi:hypothetical protein